MVIEEKLDLPLLMRGVPDAEYNPERFPGVIMRINDPRATFLIFSTGKMVLTGLRRASDAEEAVKKAVKTMKNAGVNVSNPSVEVVNIVASGELGVPIDLNMAAVVMEYAMYEPEVFPGLIYRLQDPKAVFLIFSTGKIVCTGVRDEATVKAAILKLSEQITELGIGKSGDMGFEPDDEIFF